MALTDTVSAVYQSILRTTPTSAYTQAIAAQINSGVLTISQFASQLLVSPTAQSTTFPALVLYDAFYGSTENSGGLTYITSLAAQLTASGASQEAVYSTMGSWFAAGSNNFSTLYGALDNTTYIQDVYLQVYGQLPSTGALNYLLSSLASYTASAQAAGVANAALAARGAVFGDLLNLADTAGTGNFYPAANAFMQALVTGAENGTTPTVYGQPLSALFTPPPVSVQLTPHADNATGSNIIGDLSAFIFNGVGPTLNSNDIITGTGSSATLTLTDGYGNGTDLLPVGVQIANIANVSLQTAGTAGSGGSAFNTSPFVGVTSLQVASSGGGTDFVNAASATTISVTHNNQLGGVIVTGGGAVAVTDAGAGGTIVGATGTGAVPPTANLPIGNVTVTDTNTGAGGVAVLGGVAVTVNVTNVSNTGVVSIGNTGLNTGDSPLGAATNPTGLITVNSAAGLAASTITAFGGGSAGVTINAAGATVQVGDPTAKIASNQTTGSVAVTDTLATAYTNLTGATVKGGAVTVDGGGGATVTTNTGGGVTVGSISGGTFVAGTAPAGAISVTDTSTDQAGAFGIGAYAGGPATAIVGGTSVTVNEAGGAVTLGVSLGANAPNPSGTVSVTETQASHTAVTIDGGNGVTVAAQGQVVSVGATDGTAGAQVITQSSVYTGAGLGTGPAATAITDEGGTTVTVNTTGGNVTVGGTPTTPGVSGTPSGAVAITDTFSGAATANGDAYTVQGGSTVSITATNTTSGAIAVGVAPLLNISGTALKNAALDPTGNVTIANAVTNGSTTTYGTSVATIYTNGATQVSLTGAGTGNTIADVNSFANISAVAVGTSTLATVNLDGVQGTVTIDSNALTTLTIADSLKGATPTAVTVGGLGGFTAVPAHALALTLSNDTNVGTSLSDATATSVSVATSGTSADNISLSTAKATSFTFNNGAAVTVAAGAVMSGTGSDTVTATGAGALTLGDTVGWTGAARLASINASSASGNVTVTINGDVTTFTGGSGNDVVTVEETIGLNGNASKINGGGGTNTVILTDAATLYNSLLTPTGPISADFTNFQILGFGSSDGHGATGTYDVSGFSGVTVGAVSGALSLVNAAAGETLTYTASPGNASAWALATDTGNDTLNVTLGVDGTTKTGIAVGTLTTGSGAAGIETVAINSVGVAVGGAVAAYTHTITLADTAAKTTTLTIAGDAAVTVTDAGHSIKTVTVTNNQTVDITAVTTAPTGINATGGAGLLKVAGDQTAGDIATANDVYTSGSGGVTVTVGVGGAGATLGGSETVNLAASTAAVDTINVADNIVAGKGARAVINGFQAIGSAKADVINLAGGAAQTVLANGPYTNGGDSYTASNGILTLQTAGVTAAQQLIDVQAILNTTATADQIAAIVIGGTTFVVTTGTTFTAAGDTVLQIGGLSATGFGLSGAANTIELASGNLTAASMVGIEGAPLLASGGAHTQNDTGDSYQVISGIGTGVTAVQTVNNLAAWAQIDDSATGTYGITTTQVGAAGGNELLLNMSGSGTVSALNVSGDWHLTINNTAANVITSLVDGGGTNTLTSLTITGGASLDIKAVTDTALTSIDAHTATGLVTLGDGTALSQAGLTVLGGSGGLIVTASGAADVITGLATSVGDTITANGAGDVITAGGGVNTVTANGAGDTITVGSLTTGAAIASVQIIHASGAGDTITFATTAADTTATTWTGVSVVDGGSGTIGIGSNDTIKFGTNTGVGGQTVLIAGDFTGATSSGSFASTTLSNVVHGANDVLVFNASLTEKVAGASFGASQVNVSSATSLSAALDLAAHTAALSQQAGNSPAGNIAANTGVLDWFQFGGNTYVVEAINSTSAAAGHTALGTGDEVVKIVGLVDLSASTFAAHTLHL
jgi:hypothetical protein